MVDGLMDLDGSKQIPIMEKAGHKVIAVQLPIHSLADDVETVKRAISHIGGPVTLVGHSYGGAVITNAAIIILTSQGLFILPPLLRMKANRCRLS